MNLRYEILKACAANPGAPMVEICDGIKHDRQKTTWSVRDCAKAGLLSMRRDDVTGQPGYTLTAEGKQRLAEGPGTKQGGNMKKSDSDSEGGETDAPAAFPAGLPAAFVPPDAAGQRAISPATPGMLTERARLTDAGQDQQSAHFRLIGVLADIRAAVGDPEGKLMQDELVEHIRAIYDLGEAHKRACMEWETAMMAAVGEDGVNDVVGKIASLQHKVSMQDAELFKQAGVIVDLRNQLGEARAAHHALQESPTLESIEPAGYLVRAAKRKPRTLQAEDKAREAALGAIRAGAPRAEVFALVPVGHARRGVEWRSA